MILPDNFPNNLFSLKDKVAIITGSSRGIGEAISYGFANAGSKTILASRSEKKLKSISNNINNNGGQCIAIPTDVTNHSELEMLVEKSISVFGKIDILVNSAGVAFGMESQDYSQKLWNQTYMTNLKSVFDLCQLVAKNMIENNGGSIINITSIAAILASPKNPAYNATKGGLKQLSKAFAADWAKYNIRVNNLGPGYINTELNKKSWSNSYLREERANRSLLQRWGQPTELIGPAIFLASEASSFITGQDIYVDGGFLVKSL